jgi:S-adenosylmethionine/arginine decarboxylase-like enzyme
MTLNHRHLMIDCSVHKPLNDVDKTIDFLKRLVSAIGMKIVAGPIAHYCDSEGNYGITGAVCISTSHCSIHVWDKVQKPYMRLDVYSCQDFDENIILNIIKEFEPYEIITQTIDRNPGE